MEGQKAVVPEQLLNGYTKYQTFMGNIHKKYYAIFGQKNFLVYLKVLKVFLDKNFVSPKKHIKASFMDFLFTLNIMEKGEMVTQIKSFM